MKVYISGPMTGYPGYNYPAFHAAENELRSRGYDTLNPARHPAQESWVDYLRLDLVDVLAADGLALLPGWEASRGAQLEVHVAHALGMRVLPLNAWLANPPSEEA